MRQKDKKAQLYLSEDQSIVKFDVWFNNFLTGISFETNSGKSIKCLGKNNKKEDILFSSGNNKRTIKAFSCGVQDYIDFIEFYYYEEQ